MPLIPKASADLVARDGIPRQVTADDSTQHVLYRENGLVRSMLASDWPPPLPSDPTVEEVVVALAAQIEAAERACSEATRLRQRALTLAQSVQGLRVDALTLPEARAILEILLYQAGALGSDGTVQPPPAWTGGGRAP